MGSPKDDKEIGAPKGLLDVVLGYPVGAEHDAHHP
jgi:hypothetical protein